MTTTSSGPLLAFGDPQAARSRLRGVLRRVGALDGAVDDAVDDVASVGDGDGSDVRSGVRLLSIGDHFDWGHRDERATVADDAERQLRWLARHDHDHVILLAGNHDLARVGELLPVVDDDHFCALQELADRHYYGGKHDDDEAAFFAACPWLPSTEIVARDLSSFRVSQRALVEDLLRSRRLRLAHAENGLLFTHAGITRKALTRVGLPERADVATIAARLNAALDDAVDDCLAGPRRRPLLIPGLHRPADSLGEGDGVLYHRPTHVPEKKWLEPRRFDPRRLPRGLWQVVGHVRDERCVKELQPWSEPVVAVPGVLRHLVVDNGDVRYRHGLPPARSSLPPDAAVMIFLDGALQHAPTADYQLLDVAALAAR